MLCNLQVLVRFYAGVSNEFEIEVGFVVMVHFRALCYLPESRINRWEEGVSVFDNRMDMGDYELIGVCEGLGIDLTAADDVATLEIRSLSDLVRRLERSDDRYFVRGIESSGNDDIHPFRERTADGFEGLAAHDDRAAYCLVAEELHVVGNVPQKSVILAYGIIVRDCYYYAFFHIIQLLEQEFVGTDRNLRARNPRI